MARLPAHVSSWLLVVALLVCPEVAGAEALLDAAQAGDSERVSQALADGADPNQTDAKGRTALQFAAREGHAEVVETLLRHGANVDQADYGGNTALVEASIAGHAEVVRILVDSGANIEIESARGFTAIQHARRARHGAVVKLLIEAGRRPARTQATGLPSRSKTGPSDWHSARSTKTYRPGYRKRVAAVIGVNDYQHWPRLSGARPDAEKVATRLAKLGFDPVLELYDRDATRGAILDLLGSRLPEVVDENDLVVIFFAGHGQTETIGDGARTRKRGYIIPADARVEGVFATAIPMQQLRDLTNRLAAKHVFYAMDSCYSGLGFTRALGIVKTNAVDYIDKVTSLRSVQMVTAGGEGEEVIERDGEGIFTRSLLDALDGHADANHDGYVTATEIGAYVAPRVTNETGARQSPQSGRLEGEGEIAFEIPAGR